MKNCKAVTTAIEEGKCMFGTVDTWIIWVCEVCMHVFVYVHVIIWWECKQVISSCFSLLLPTHRTLQVE